MRRLLLSRSSQSGRERLLRGGVPHRAPRRAGRRAGGAGVPGPLGRRRLGDDDPQHLPGDRGDGATQYPEPIPYLAPVGTPIGAGAPYLNELHGVGTPARDGGAVLTDGRPDRGAAITFQDVAGLV